jgi:hypothetical protein
MCSINKFCFSFLRLLCYRKLSVDFLFGFCVNLGVVNFGKIAFRFCLNIYSVSAEKFSERCFTVL